MKTPTMRQCQLHGITSQLCTALRLYRGCTADGIPHHVDDALHAATQTAVAALSSPTYSSRLPWMSGPACQGKHWWLERNAGSHLPCVNSRPACCQQVPTCTCAQVASCHKGRPLPCAGQLCTLQWSPGTCVQQERLSICCTLTMPAQCPQVAMWRTD